MVVRILHRIAGLIGDAEFRAGRVVDLPQAEAQHLIKLGAAEEVIEEVIEKPKQKKVLVQEVKAVKRPVRKTVKK